MANEKDTPEERTPRENENMVFAVMRNPYSGALIPFMRDEVLATWPTQAAAREALKDHMYAQAWVTDLYEFGTGDGL